MFDGIMMDDGSSVMMSSSLQTKGFPSSFQKELLNVQGRKDRTDGIELLYVYS
jgi:hypothetical protein